MSSKERLSCLVQDLRNSIQTLAADNPDEEEMDVVLSKTCPNLEKLVGQNGETDPSFFSKTCYCLTEPTEDEEEEPPESPFSSQNKGPPVFDGDRTRNFYNNYNIPFRKTGNEKPKPVPNRKVCGKAVTVDGKSPVCDPEELEEAEKKFGKSKFVEDKFSASIKGVSIKTSCDS